MASTSVVTDIKNGITNGIIVIEFDAVPSETHTLSNTVTDHPVESGANVSDHSRPEPIMLALDCVISNTPLTTVQQQRAIRLGTVDFTAEHALEIMPGRAQITYEQLEALRRTGALLSVVTTLKVYRNMVIQSLTVPRSAQTSNGLHFTIAFKEIRVVQNRFTTTNVSKRPGTGSRVDTGPQTPKEVPINRSRAKAAQLSAQGKGFAAGAVDAIKTLFDGEVRGAFNVQDAP